MGSYRISPTLIFAVSALYLLMHSFLNLTLQYTSSCWLVVSGDLEDVRGIDPVIAPAPHASYSAGLELVDGDIAVGRRVDLVGGARHGGVRIFAVVECVV